MWQGFLLGLLVVAVLLLILLVQMRCYYNRVIRPRDLLVLQCEQILATFQRQMQKQHYWNQELYELFCELKQRLYRYSSVEDKPWKMLVGGFLPDCWLFEEGEDPFLRSWKPEIEKFRLFLEPPTD
jgi:hypothetical protein